MLVSEFQHFVDSVLPPHRALPGDMIGLHVANATNTANRVLVCLEITDAVIAEAVELDCDFILTFHPLIYSPLARLDGRDRVSRLVAELIRRDIGVYCVHTAFDVSPFGTNNLLAEALDLTPTKTLTTSDSDGTGMGLVCSCNISFNELVDRVNRVCGGPVRFVAPVLDNVVSVAIVAGSGMSFFPEALASGAQVFITADVRYHDFHAARGSIGIIDPGHFEMERFVPAGIIELLVSNNCQNTLIESAVDTNPVSSRSTSKFETLA